jgi:hypothetical protein
MGKRAGITTKEYLINTPLPEHAGTYTVISHEFIINKTKEVLASKGFQIEHELYRCNEGGDIAQGVYHLKFNGEQDPEMSMMFAWANSYDKTMRFKCAVGGYLNASKSVIISGKLGSWGRKHTGAADIETSDMIQSQIENAETYYKQLVEDKASMKSITITKTKRAELLGRIYLEHELLTTEQVSLVKAEIKKPSFDYNCSTDSLWSFYTAMVYALQKAHPRTWMDQQRMIHWFLAEDFGIIPGYIAEAIKTEGVTVSEVVSDNQITIEQVIAEEESKDEEAPPWHDEIVTEPVEPRTLEGHVAFANESGESLTVVETVVLEPVIEEDTWPCMKCEEEQGPTAVWHDGQLCAKCFEESNPI